MRRFFGTVSENEMALSGAEAIHAARVLRLRAGDEILVLAQGEEYICALETVTSELCTGKVREKRQCQAEPRLKITLYLAQCKADKMEFAAQKAVELGAGAFVPFVSERCVKVPEGNGLLRQRERLDRIAHEAVKQCGRSREMEIEPAICFEELLKRISQHERCIFAWECATKELREALRGNYDDLALIIGCEGGFSEEEAQQIVAAGAFCVSLGSRILRAETAAVALLAVAAYETRC